MAGRTDIISFHAIGNRARSRHLLCCLFLVLVCGIFYGAACADDCAFDYRYTGSMGNWAGGNTSGTLSGPCNQIEAAYRKYQALGVFQVSNIYRVGGGHSGGQTYDNNDAVERWAEYFRALAEQRRKREEIRQQEEAHRRAAEEDRRRQEQRLQNFTAKHQNAIALIQGRSISGTGNSSGAANLSPVSVTSKQLPPDFGLKGINSMKVHVPDLSAAKTSSDAALKENSEPFIKTSISPETAALIGTVGKCIGEIPSKALDTIVSVTPYDMHYKIIKLVYGLQKEVGNSIDKAVDLIKRGYPEAETKAFVNESENRVMRVYIENLSEIPLPPENEKELQRKGYKWFNWMDRSKKEDE